MPGLPLLGNTLDFLRDTSGFLRRAYREHGPIYRIRMLWLKFTVLLGAEAKEFMLQGGEKHLTRHPVFDPVGEQLGSADFALAVSGEKHLQLRQLLQLAYSREVASACVPELISSVQEVLREWPAGSRRPVFESIQLLAFQQYCQVMGHVSLREHYADCRRVTDMNMEVGGRVLPLFMFHWPPYRAARQRVLKLVHGLVGARKSAAAATERPPDIIDTLLALKFPDGRHLSTDEVVCYAMYGFAGSCSYLGRLVSFMLFEIFQRPELQARLTAEVDAAFQRGLKNASDVSQMRLLRAVYHETLRFHPVSQGMPYVAKEEFEFQGRRVAQGDLVVLSQLPLLFSERPFTEPEKFDPERCLEPRNEHRKGGAFLPFGMHHRICAAMGLVELMSLTLVATLLHEQKLTMDPADYRLKLVVKPLPAPDGNFQMRSEPRAEGHRAPNFEPEPLVEEVCLADFPGADHPAVLAALQEGKIVEVPGRTDIIRQGDAADAFYLLLDGQVDVYRTDSDGQTTLQAVLEPGDYFGEVGLLRHAPRSATVRGSSEKVTVLRLSAASFRKVVAESDMVSQEIARVARKRTSRDRIIKLVRELSELELSSRLPEFERHTFTPGEVILRQGDRPDWFYLLVQGTARVTRHEAGEAEHEVANLETGRYFGETGMLHGSLRNATVTVSSPNPAVVYRCDAPSFRHLVDEAGDLAVALVRRLKGGKSSGVTSIF